MLRRVARGVRAAVVVAAFGGCGRTVAPSERAEEAPPNVAELHPDVGTHEAPTVEQRYEFFCNDFASLDDQALAVGGGDPVQLARVSDCPELEELLIYDLATFRHMTRPTMDIDLGQLPRMTSIEALEIGACRCRGWDHLATFPRLRELRVGPLASPMDVTAIGSIVGLETLVLAGDVPGGLEPLRQLVNLETLIVQDDTISDLRPLAALRSLKRLELSVASDADVSPLAGLALEELHLSGVALGDLGRLPRQLRSLEIYESELRDLSPLARCTTLEHLVVVDSPVVSVAPLGRLRRLETLALDGTRVRDLSPVLRLPRLTSLSIRGIDMDPEKIRAIEKKFGN